MTNKQTDEDALRLAHEKEDIGAALNKRLDLLGDAFRSLRFPQGDPVEDD
nr:MAG TPA: hypothetical protein [Caudoviricetes sp.]